MAIKTLEDMFGFPRGTDVKPKFKKEELLDRWVTIGDDAVFSSLRAKSNAIRNPCIRYFQKAMANVLYARKKTGPINNGEIQLLDIALKDILVYTKNKVPMKGDTNDASPSMCLLNHLCGFRKWALANKQKRTISIGGVITPILMACGVPLQSTPFVPRWIDIPHLRWALFIDHQSHEGMHILKFQLRTEMDARFLLPNQELTTITVRGNIDFNPPNEELFFMEQAPPTREAPVIEERVESEREAENEDGEEMDWENYNVSRFHFEEYKPPPRVSKSLTVAHKNIGSMSAWNKFQDRMLKKCGKAIAAIQAVLSCSSSGATMVRENRPEEVVSRRHRVSPSRQSAYEQREVCRPQAPARHSSHEHHEQKRRRKTRIVRPRSKDLLMSSRRSLDQDTRRDIEQSVK